MSINSQLIKMFQRMAPAAVLLIIFPFMLSANVMQMPATAAMQGWTTDPEWSAVSDITSPDYVYASTDTSGSNLFTVFTHFPFPDATINSVKLKVMHVSTGVLGTDAVEFNFTMDNGSSWITGNEYSKITSTPMENINTDSELDITSYYTWNAAKVNSFGIVLRPNGPNFTLLEVDYIGLVVDYTLPTYTVTPSVSPTVTATPTFTSTVTNSQTFTTTPSPTATGTSTPLVYTCIQPNTAVAGDITSFTYHISASGNGPVSNVLILVPAGVTVNSLPAASTRGGAVSNPGGNIFIDYTGIEWSGESDPNFDDITFTAILPAGLKNFGALVNSLFGAVIPNGYSQQVSASLPTFTMTGTPTFTATASNTATFTATYTPTGTDTEINTATWTFTGTATGTATPTFTSTPSATHTGTPTFSVTPTSTSSFTDTATLTPTYTATPSATVTATSTPAAYAYIQPNAAVAGDITTFTFHIAAAGSGMINRVLILVPGGVAVNSLPANSARGGAVSNPGGNILIDYTGIEWSNMSNPNFDDLTFTAVSTAGVKNYFTNINNLFTAPAPNGFFEDVNVSVPTATATDTITLTLTPTFTVTSTITGTNTATNTPTYTPTPTDSQTFTPSFTETITATPTFTATLTLIPSVTYTPTITPTLQLIISTGPANPSSNTYNFNALVTAIQVRFTAIGGPVSVGEIKFNGNPDGLNWTQDVVPGSCRIYLDNGTTPGALDGGDTLIKGNGSFYDQHMGFVDFTGSPSLFMVNPGTPVDILFVFTLAVADYNTRTFMNMLDSANVVAQNPNNWIPLTAIGNISGTAAGNTNNIYPMTRTATPTFTVTPTYTATPTVTQSVTPTYTVTQTGTPTCTQTPSATPTFTVTLTQTPTYTVTQTDTPTFTVTQTATATDTVTPTVTPTYTVTPTITPTCTATQTATPTYTVTQTQTPTFTVTATVTPTYTVTETATPTYTVTQTVTPTYTVTQTTTPTYTITRTVTQTSTVTPTVTATTISTPAAFAYIEPNSAVSGNQQLYTYKVIASGNGPISRLFIDIPSGASLSSAPSSTMAGVTFDTTGGKITVYYSTPWNVFSTQSFDVITFAANSNSGDKYYGSTLNGLIDAAGVTPNGYSQIVVISTPTFTITATNTPTFTVTPTYTPTYTVTPTNTPTSSATQSVTPTSTVTQTNTPTFTVTKTNTPTYTVTQTITPTYTATPTYTPTGTVTQTNTPTYTVTQTVTPTSTVTKTATPTSTVTATITQTHTPTPSVTPTSTVTQSNTPTVTQTTTPTATVTPTFTASYTPTFTATPSSTRTVTPTITTTNTPTNTATPTATPTYTPMLGMYVMVPGEVTAFTAPGYTGTPVPQEAGSLVTITVRAVEKNNWTQLNVNNTIDITSSNNAWTILDTDRDMTGGLVNFHVRFLRPGLYSITAKDMEVVYAGYTSDPIPVIVTGFGNIAQIAETGYQVYSGVKGETNIKIMDLTVTNPNSGGASFRLTGVTLTVSTSVNSAVSRVVVRNSNGLQLNEAVWGAAKTVFVPINVLIDPLTSQTVSLTLDISESSPDISFNVAIAANQDVLVEKLDNTRQFVESTTGNFPYTSTNINITSGDIKSSFYNYPNPFKPGTEITNIRYYLDSDAKVTLRIYDLLSRRVKTVMENEQETGDSSYIKTWDGRNDSGQTVLTGVYYGVLKVEGGSQYHIKIIVVR